MKPIQAAPIPNSYWALPDYLIAGEYPGARDAEPAHAKLSALLDAGVRLFVDLTEAGELEPYGSLLEDLARERQVEARHVRCPIRDVSVPRAPQEMAAILDLLDDARRSGAVAYVHCWGGTGRTGVVVGCLYRRHGMTGEAALERVLAGWRTMAKAPVRERRGLTSPETREQMDYVRRWAEPGRVPAGGTAAGVVGAEPTGKGQARA